MHAWLSRELIPNIWWFDDLHDDDDEDVKGSIGYVSFQNDFKLLFWIDFFYFMGGISISVAEPDRVPNGKVQTTLPSLME